MKNFEFNSQIATTVEQSKRLLELGLKKETADMVWIKELAWDEVAHCTYDAETYMLRPIDYLEGESHRGHIPAWSLHRLIELATTKRKVMLIRVSDDLYDTLIDKIDRMIANEVFNPEYLEE